MIRLPCRVGFLIIFDRLYNEKYGASYALGRELPV